jgi:hypothetical protein
VIRSVFSLLIILTALAAGVHRPQIASAAFTPISDSPDRYDEPNLIGVNPFPSNPNPSVLETLYGESNLRRVDDRWDVAFRHTGVEAIVTPVAKFAEGGYLLFCNPNRVKLQPFFGQFVAGVTPMTPVGYDPQEPSGSILLADSGRSFGFQFHHAGYSDPSFNSRSVDILVTYEIIDDVGRPDNNVGNFVLCWEGTPNTDRDYQDVVFEISGATPIPEPACGLLIATALLGLSCRRRTH